MKAQRGLLSLNDDALLSVFSFLYGKEALGIVLASKRLHDLAIPRVAAIAKCSSPIAFVSLCHYMLHGPQLRAHYLEILDVRLVSMGQNHGAAEGSHRRLLADLLAAAQHIRQLTLSYPPSSSEERLRIGSALATMRNLVDLHFCDVDDDALNLLSILSGSLIRLKLWYNSRSSQTHSTVSALLRALTKHTRLERLELRLFRPSEPSVRVFSVEHTRFTSLRHLTMAGGNTEAVWLVDLCPQLTVLAALLVPPTTDPPTAARWPPLNELYVHASFALLAQHRIGRVERIKFLQTTSYEDLLALQGPLDTMLRAASPVRLTLSIWAEPATMNILVSVLKTLPRLRTLSLHMERVRDFTDTASEEQWLVNNVRLLGGLRMASLRLIITFMDLASFDSPTPQQPEHERRTATMVPLPVQLIQAMPTLRLLGVVSEYWTLTDMKPSEEGNPSNTDDSASHWYKPLWERPVACIQYYRRWWRTGEGAGLTEVPSKEGEEMMQELERSVISGTPASPTRE